MPGGDPQIAPIAQRGEGRGIVGASPCARPDAIVTGPDAIVTGPDAIVTGPDAIVTVFCAYSYGRPRWVAPTTPGIRQQYCDGVTRGCRGEPMCSPTARLTDRKPRG
jgi:hypothetical protein